MEETGLSSMNMGRPGRSEVLTNEKLEIYLDVINLFTSFTDPKIQRMVAQNPKKQEALGQQMTKIGMRLALIGADSVVKGYVEFRQLAQTGEAEPEDIVRCFGDIMLKMRNDLHPDTGLNLTVDDMLGSFIVGKV